MDTTRIDRLLRLILLLQSGRPRGAAELMDELGVSRRTFFRDLKALQQAGIPCTHERGRGYRLGDGFFLPPISLTVPETLGLMTLGKAAVGDRERPLVQPALSAIYKLLSTVPEPIRSACGEMMAHVSIDPGARGEHSAEAQHFTTLQRAADEGRACHIVYEPPAGVGGFTTELEPYALHFAARAWYVLGKTELHREVRVLKLTRIAELTLIDRLFDRPARFHVDDKLDGAWQLIPGDGRQTVVLDFTQKVATNVTETRWHPTQQHTERGDGGVRVTFEVNGLTEIAWWVCGYADQVKVVKPKALADRVKQMHAAAAGLY